MRIGIIGAGNIGGTLGAKWAAAGHTVTFGARNPESAKARAALSMAGEAAHLASIATALSDAEVILLSLPGAAVAEFVEEHGAALNNKVVIDATNQFGKPVINGIAVIQAAAPQAGVIRAFNSLGWENFADPLVGGVRADLFYCSPAALQSIAEQLISAIGLTPVRVGELAQAPLVDNIGALWGALVFGQGKGRHLAFKLLLPA